MSRNATLYRAFFSEQLKRPKKMMGWYEAESAAAAVAGAPARQCVVDTPGARRSKMLLVFHHHKPRPWLYNVGWRETGNSGSIIFLARPVAMR